MNAEQAVVGARVKTLIEFSGVPAGTEGVITEDYGKGVMVRWQGLDGFYVDGWKPLADGFDKRLELNFLELVEAHLPKEGA